MKCNNERRWASVYSLGLSIPYVLSRRQASVVQRSRALRNTSASAYVVAGASWPSTSSTANGMWGVVEFILVCHEKQERIQKQMTFETSFRHMTVFIYAPRSLLTFRPRQYVNYAAAAAAADVAVVPPARRDCKHSRAERPRTHH